MSRGSSSPTSPCRPDFSSASAATRGAAQRARHEAVRARADVRVQLRAVHLEQARVLVELVLHGVGGDDLDVHRDLPRRVGPDGDAVPRVRREEQVERRPAHLGGHWPDYTAGRAGLPPAAPAGAEWVACAPPGTSTSSPPRPGPSARPSSLPALRAAGHAAHAHVLPPAAASDAGDAERLRQEIALVAGAVRAALADGGTLLLADERAALAVPETMRLLLDEQGLAVGRGVGPDARGHGLPLRQPQERAAPPLLAPVVPRGRAAAAPGDPLRDQPPPPRRGRGALARRRRAPPPPVAVPGGRGAPAAARGRSR